MRHHRFSISFVTACALALFTSFFSLSARAAVTINSVDGSRVSAYQHVPTSGIDALIFGGVAGTACTGAAGTSANSTCSNCYHTGSGDGGLIACNDQRINPNLQMTISFTSTDHDGYPFIALETTTGTGTILTQTVAPQFVSKTNQASMTITWLNICATLPITGAGGPLAVNCALGTGNLATAKFYVGVSAVSGTLAATDDKLEFTITLASGDSTVPTLAADPNGLTYFEFVSGDGLGEIRNPLKGSTSSFPIGTGINYRWVRVLFEKRAAGSANTAVWSSINPGSPHTDLEITATNSNTNFDLSPIRISSGSGTDPTGAPYTVSIDNATDTVQNVYDLKLAVVDQARNASYYTPASDDTKCNSDLSKNQSTGVKECHTIRPSVVAGILKDKLNCFVATAAYGSPMASEVDAFRHFRDTYLIPTKLGLEFVRTYYKYGPIAARFIAQSENLRAISRGLLWAPLQFAKFSMAYGIYAGLGLLALGIALIFVPIVAIKHRRRSSRPHA